MSSSGVLIIKTCAHCGRPIERCDGRWLHADGWQICDPRAQSLTFAEPHPMESPAAAGEPCPCTHTPPADPNRSDR